MSKTHPYSDRDDEKDIADLFWKLKRVSAHIGRAVANHDFDDAHAESGRLADIIEDYERTHTIRSNPEGNA